MSSLNRPLDTPTRLMRSGVVPPAPMDSSLLSTSRSRAPRDSKRSVSARLSRIAFSSSHPRGVLVVMTPYMPCPYFNGR